MNYTSKRKFPENLKASTHIHEGEGDFLGDLSVLAPVCHALRPLQNFGRCRPDAVHSAQEKPSGAGAFVGGHQIAVEFEVGELKGHLQIGIRAAFAGLDKIFAVICVAVHVEIEVLDQTVEGK